MKKILAIIMTLIISLSIMAKPNMEQSILLTDTNLEYIILSDSTVEVAKSDSYKQFDTIFIPKYVRIDDKTYTVERIGDNAFNGCNGLFYVKLFENVKHIGENAFAGCTSLENVDFCWNSKIVIGDGAFRGCTKLKSIKSLLPTNSVDIAISNCVGCDHIGGRKKPGEIVGIGNEAFSGCSSLEDLPISNEVASIGRETFAGCKRLKEIKFPRHLRMIGERAFFHCVGLETVYIYEDTSFIGNEAFSGNEDLVIYIFNLKENIKIGQDAFDGCRYVSWMK